MKYSQATRYAHTMIVKETLTQAPDLSTRGLCAVLRHLKLPLSRNYANQLMQEAFKTIAEEQRKKNDPEEVQYQAMKEIYTALLELRDKQMDHSRQTEALVRRIREVLPDRLKLLD